MTRKISEIREPGKNYDLYEPDDGVPEIYVDGFAGFGRNASNIRINLYSVQTNRKEKDILIEDRLLKIRIIMPTVNWIEMAMNTIAIIGSDKKNLIEGADDLKNRLTTLFQNIEIEKIELEKGEKQ